MFAIMISVVGSMLTFLLRSVLVKFVVFFALFFVVSGFIAVLSSSGVLPSASSVTGSLSGIPAGVWFFLDLFRIDFGISLMFAALASRFIIRRIPLIG